MVEAFSQMRFLVSRFKIWSAVAIPIYGERHRFGSCTLFHQKRRRRFALPAHSTCLTASSVRRISINDTRGELRRLAAT